MINDLLRQSLQRRFRFLHEGGELSDGSLLDLDRLLILSDFLHAVVLLHDFVRLLLLQGGDHFVNRLLDLLEDVELRAVGELRQRRAARAGYARCLPEQSHAAVPVTARLHEAERLGEVVARVVVAEDGDRLCCNEFYSSP